MQHYMLHYIKIEDWITRWLATDWLVVMVLK